MPNHHTPTDYEREQADNALDLIIQRKRDLRDWLSYACRDLPEQAKNLRDLMEDAFDDAYHLAWHGNRVIAQSAEWSYHIPAFEKLRGETPVARADREYQASPEYADQERRMQEYKAKMPPVPTNPETRDMVDSVSAHLGSVA